MGQPDSRIPDANEDEIGVIQHGINSLVDEIDHQAAEHEETEKKRLNMHREKPVQLLLGHTKLESTVRYPGIEVNDAL